ncbi:MAG: type II toxin-antitoxin system VapC family toxin [Terracidiphilus sp.]|jgi:predicted nucleic acid-binding protein
MRTAVDSNIFSSIWSWEPTAEKVAEQLGKAKQEGALIISPFVFAELHAHPKMTADSVRGFLESAGVAVDLRIDEQVWSIAGLRYARCAARLRQAIGEGPRRILADFLIGAHALLQAERLMTLDPSRYRLDFPELRLL